MSQRSPTDFADFLDSPSALQKCIPGLDATRTRKSRFNAMTGRIKPAVLGGSWVFFSIQPGESM
jgi:hypothetical protein